MRTDFEKRAKVMTTKRRLHKTWMRVVSTLAAITVFCTTYALILPAITISAETYCEHEEHEHTEACYERQLICALEETEEHVVTEEILVDAGHIHTEECYEVETVLVCELEEVEAQEEIIDEETGEVIQEAVEGHTHSDACYEEVQNVICGQEEKEAVYETKEELVEGHVHSDACYEDVLVCKIEEHKHTEECFSNKKADLETASMWKKTLPKAEELNKGWREDTLKIAQSQVGYKESEANFIVQEGERKGYTRYGAWYGAPYSDWCAMFLQFSMHYAGVSTAYMKGDASVPRWVKAEAKKGNFYGTDYTPQAGDIIFFDWDKDNSANHVGIVEEVKLNADGVATEIITIEGNSSNAVRRNAYKANDATILGYSIIPEKPETEEEIAAREAEEAAAEAEAEEAVEETTEENTEEATIEAILGEGTEENAEEAAEAVEETEAVEEAEAVEETEEVVEEATELEETVPVAAGTLTAEGEDYTITVSYGEDAMVPENATLTVEEVSPSAESYSVYNDAAAEGVYGHSESLPYARFFDITIRDAEGNEIEPAATVSVVVDLKDRVLDTEDVDFAAVHFKDKKTEAESTDDANTNTGEEAKAPAEVKPENIEMTVLDITTDEVVAFDTDSFSVYGFVYYYTVDFYYNKPVEAEGSSLLHAVIGEKDAVIGGEVVEYHMPGGTQMELSQLFTELGIDRKTKDIETLVFTNDLLVSFTPHDDDYTITSLAPFHTSEVLTITFKNGDEIQIGVEDAISVNTWEDLQRKIDEGYTDIELANGVAAVAVDRTITIPSGKNVTINFKNAYIGRQQGHSTKMSSFFKVEGGTLNVKNAKFTGYAINGTTKTSGQYTFETSNTNASNEAGIFIGSTGGNITLDHCEFNNIRTGNSIKNTAPIAVKNTTVTLNSCSVNDNEFKPNNRISPVRSGFTNEWNALDDDYLGKRCKTEYGYTADGQNTADGYWDRESYKTSGAILVNGGTVTANSTSLNRNLGTTGAVTIIGGGTFIQNNGSINENYGYSGGAVSIVNGKYVLNSGQVNGNKSIFFGTINVSCNDAAVDLGVGGGRPTISGNETLHKGGAMYINSDHANLQSGDINNNTAWIFGGGLYLEHNRTTKLQNAAIYDNEAVRDHGAGHWAGHYNGRGGGFWTCPTGTTYYQHTKVGLQDNTANDKGQDFFQSPTSGAQLGSMNSAYDFWRNEIPRDGDTATGEYYGNSSSKFYQISDTKLVEEYRNSEIAIQNWFSARYRSSRYGTNWRNHKDLKENAAGWGLDVDNSTKYPLQIHENTAPNGGGIASNGIFAMTDEKIYETKIHFEKSYTGNASKRHVKVIVELRDENNRVIQFDGQNSKEVIIRKDANPQEATVNLPTVVYQTVGYYAYEALEGKTSLEIAQMVGIGNWKIKVTEKVYDGEPTQNNQGEDVWDDSKWINATDDYYVNLGTSVELDEDIDTFMHRTVLKASLENTSKESPKGEFTPEANKDLTGRELQNGEFTFDLYRATDAWATTGNPIQTKTNNANGKIMFDTITDLEPGTYRYIIKERVPNPMAAGTHYDKSEKRILVTVTSNGTIANTQVDGNNPTFTNKKYSWTVSKVDENNEPISGNTTFEVWRMDGGWHKELKPAEGSDTVTIDDIATWFNGSCDNYDRTMFYLVETVAPSDRYELLDTAIPFKVATTSDEYEGYRIVPINKTTTESNANASSVDATTTSIRANNDRTSAQLIRWNEGGETVQNISTTPGENGMTFTVKNERKAYDFEVDKIGENNQPLNGIGFNFRPASQTSGASTVLLGEASNGVEARYAANKKISLTPNAPELEVGEIYSIWEVVPSGTNVTPVPIDIAFKIGEDGKPQLIAANDPVRATAETKKLYLYNGTAHTNSSNAAADAYWEVYDSLIAKGIIALSNDGLKLVVKNESPTSYNAEKVWADGIAGTSWRPEAIILTLHAYKADGTEATIAYSGQKQVRVTEDDDWKYTWSNLPKKDIYGNDVTYRVQEAAVNLYSTSYRYVGGNTSANSSAQEITWSDLNPKSYTGVTRLNDTPVRILVGGNKAVYVDAYGEVYLVSATNPAYYEGTLLKATYSNTAEANDGADVTFKAERSYTYGGQEYNRTYYLGSKYSSDYYGYRELTTYSTPQLFNAWAGYDRLWSKYSGSKYSISGTNYTSPVYMYTGNGVATKIQTATFPTSTQAANAGTTYITNTYNAEASVDLTIEKRDATLNQSGSLVAGNNKLPNAVFHLYPVTSSNGEWVRAGDTIELTTDENGQATTQNIKTTGYYKLVEFSAPQGYQPLGEDQYVIFHVSRVYEYGYYKYKIDSVTDNTGDAYYSSYITGSEEYNATCSFHYVLKLGNVEATYELPETGGIGTTIFTIIGLILVAIAVTLLAMRRVAVRARSTRSRR